MHTQIVQNLLKQLVNFHYQYRTHQQPQARPLAIFSLYIANLLRQIKRERDAAIAAHCSQEASQRIMTHAICIAKNKINVPTESAAAASPTVFTEKVQKTYQVPHNFEYYLTAAELELLPTAPGYCLLTLQMAIWLSYNAQRAQDYKINLKRTQAPITALAAVDELIALLTDRNLQQTPPNTWDLRFVQHYRLSCHDPRWIDLDNDACLHRVFHRWIEKDQTQAAATEPPHPSLPCPNGGLIARASATKPSHLPLPCPNKGLITPSPLRPLPVQALEFVPKHTPQPQVSSPASSLWAAPSPVRSPTISFEAEEAFSTEIMELLQSDPHHSTDSARKKPPIQPIHAIAEAFTLFAHDPNPPAKVNRRHICAAVAEMALQSTTPASTLGTPTLNTL